MWKETFGKILLRQSMIDQINLDSSKSSFHSHITSVHIILVPDSTNFAEFVR